MSILPLLTVTCLAPPVISRLKRRPTSVTLLFLGVAVSVLGVAGLLAVFLDWRAGWLLVVVAPLLCVASLLPPQKSGAGWVLALLGKRRVIRGLLVMCLTLVILIGGTEWTVFMLERIGVIELESPIRTVLEKGSADWRKASIIADYKREPDPVLFWRSRPVPPYNAQRFQGPIAKVPKPDDVFRIICYGDSNTDGHTGDGGWPARLGKLLEKHEWQPDKRVEVLNAGVMGYSSHQGLMRFKEEAQTYQPDLIFVSFGWNDAPGALGKPDKEFEIPPETVVTMERALLRFKSYRLLRTLRREWSEEKLETVGPRVAVEDYAANLSSFLDHGKQHDVLVVLLTRPHLASVSDLKKQPGWRSKIPSYNDALVTFAREKKVPLVDVGAHFASRLEQFSDECHFTAEGHEKMARLLSDELSRLLDG